jgi:hypothetical protein
MGCNVINFSDFNALKIKRLAKKAHNITKIKIKIFFRRNAFLSIFQKKKINGSILRRINKKLAVWYKKISIFLFFKANFSNILPEAKAIDPIIGIYIVTILNHLLLKEAIKL